MHNRLIYNILKTYNQSFIKKLILALLIITSSCSSVKRLALDRDTSDILKSSPVFSKHFTGFSLYDLNEEKLIASHNADMLFTPASNTKLLTMYIALRSFQDSIPGALVREKNRTIYVKPFGDPTFLHPSFSSQRTFNFLKSYDSLVIIDDHKKIKPYGPGWAWDDYAYSFQPQRTSWPIYGNVVRIKQYDSSLVVMPDFFSPFVDLREQDSTSKIASRDLRFNRFTVFTPEDTSSSEQSIPFETSQGLLIELLKDTLNIKVGINRSPILVLDTLFSQQLDTVLAKMMKTSDNFLAEQLFLMSAWKNGYQSFGGFRDYIKNVWLTELDETIWVDGSGLSRYNLISPISLTRLLKKTVDEFGWDRVTSILPSGGEGTLNDLYLSENPYIFAKTGTLSNNHNLSGFLITNSGKKLAFSFMNNHYHRPTLEIKKEMEIFINQIKEAY